MERQKKLRGGAKNPSDKGFQVPIKLESASNTKDDLSKDDTSIIEAKTSKIKIWLDIHC